MDFATQDWQVILADDDDDWRQLVARSLRHAGLEVLEAHDGEELLALHRIASTSARRLLVVISDVEMPKCDGITAVTALRCLSAALPILVITGLSDPLIHERVAAAGASAILTKPVSPHAVMPAMRAMLSREHV